VKKVLSLILVLCISIMLFVIPTYADGEVFVAAGNTVLPLTDAMPIRSSGVWYIDYQCFTKGNLGVNTSYNAADGTLVLYTWDTTLIFDLNKTTAYTATEKVPYKAVSFVSSGTVYVPVQFTAQMLGFEYVYFADLPMIRIRRSSDIPSNMFIYIAENQIPQLLEAYKASKNESSTSNSPQQSTGSGGESSENSDNGTEQKNIRLTFNISNGSSLKSILDSLSRYGYRATFFIQGNTINSCKNELRRAVALGHSIGLLAENGDSDFAKSDTELKASLDKTNELLFKVAKTKSRLVRIPSGSTSVPGDKIKFLISCGYRIWDDTITPSGNTAGRIYSSAVSALEASRRTTDTITLRDSDVYVNALTRILRYLNTNKYRTFSINLLDTPVNDVGEKR